MRTHAYVTEGHAQFRQLLLLVQPKVGVLDCGHL